jgi:hypothetical protein
MYTSSIVLIFQNFGFCVILEQAYGRAKLRPQGIYMQLMFLLIVICVYKQILGILFFVFAKSNFSSCPPLK